MDKPLTLIGEPNSVIDGQSRGEILRIVSNQLLVQGLTFQNVGITSLEEWSGIKVKEVSHNIIRGNHFQNAFFALYLSNSNHVQVLDNTLGGVAHRGRLRQRHPRLAVRRPALHVLARRRLPGQHLPPQRGRGGGDVFQICQDAQQYF
ncbi:right-handed parallel beta-helix repeat-containing protein [Salmonirosea aquatica]|uniref:right-handed parallel beta-helix repeat-containing protein n=1 Tax=Salmonirosea aquatica TaxID=2654236 RepID=UPI00128C0497